jgi:cyclase
MIRRALCLLALPAVLAAQPRWDTVTVKAQPLRGGVYLITGSGGNIGLSTGSDAAFLVDDQYAPLTAKIIAAVDHSGGNENLGKTGALLVAHNNVRKRMSTEQFMAANRRVPASPPGALPVVTFTDSVSFHINGDQLVAFHVPSAHTDGDVIVHFTQADVIHMGDAMMTNSYPYVDLSSGGNVAGFITAADRALTVCGPRTIVIPGHGAVTDCAGLRGWRDMIATVRDRVRAEMQRGMTLEQMKAAALTASFDAQWGKGFIQPPMFVEAVYRSLGGK